MCFILKKENSTILSAWEDIEVAKCGIKTSSSSLVSLPRLKKYTFGTTYQSDIEIFPGPISGEFLTGKGLYSIKRESAYESYQQELYKYYISCYHRALYKYPNKLYKFVVCKAIIPKGSNYIQSSLGYVSDKLIVLDEIIPNELTLNSECTFYKELKEIFY